MTSNNNWYRGGLAFVCQGCGNCCSGPVEGYVWMNPETIEAMAAFLKMPMTQFKNRYIRRVGLRCSLIEKQPGKDCIFLSKNNKGKECQVYPVRPIQCRTWPFWKENIRSQSCWNEIAKNCPGIDKGQWHTAEQIVALSNGDLSVDQQTTDIVEAALTWISAHADNAQCLSAVEQLYSDIEQHLAGIDSACDNCGKCCDFDRYGHRLYVTTLEMLYFWYGLAQSHTNQPPETGKTPPDGPCPYRQDQGCVIRPFRPASCRIFYCRAVPEKFQNELTEQVLQRLRKLHEQFAAPYYYADLRQWLSSKNPICAP